MGDRAKNMGKMLNNPKQRNIYIALVVGAAIMLGIGLYIAAGSSDQAHLPSGASVSAVPNVNAVPGTSTSEEYNKQVNLANKTAAEKALQNNNSFIPTPTNQNSMADTSPIDLIDKQRAEQRRLKEEQDLKDAAELAKIQQAERDALANTPPAPLVVNFTPEQKHVEVKKPKYSEADYIIISTLMGQTKSKASFSEFNFAGEVAENNNAGSVDNVQTASNTQGVNTTTPAPLAKAGTIFNAILETAVNSDEPGPVLAKIISGPLAGTKLIGSIQNVGQKVILQFSTANIPSAATSLGISAVAVDPETSRTALASDVNNHYIQRYGVLLASSFLTGWAQAITQNNSTSVISPLTGSVTTVSNGELSNSQINKQALGQVGTELGNSVRQSTQNMKPTVKVNSGIAIGILLMSDLTVK